MGDWCYEYGKRMESLKNRRRDKFGGETDGLEWLNVEFEPHVSDAGLDDLVTSKVNQACILCPQETLV